MRPSSSYAFGKALHMADLLAPAIIQGQELSNYQAYSWTLRTMDKVFLSVLKHQPEIGPDLFRAMGSRITGSRFARFMVGQPTASDLRYMIGAMPKLPFLAAVARGGFL